MLDIETVRRIANQNGFDEVQYNDVSRVIAFQKGYPPCRVNVYYSTGTVATCLDHPRSGKTQLFRRGQSLDDLAGIFSNPRQHTGVGFSEARVGNHGNQLMVRGDKVRLSTILNATTHVGGGTFIPHKMDFAMIDRQIKSLHSAN